MQSSYTMIFRPPEAQTTSPQQQLRSGQARIVNHRLPQPGVEENSLKVINLIISTGLDSRMITGFIASSPLLSLMVVPSHQVMWLASQRWCWAPALPNGYFHFFGQQPILTGRQSALFEILLWLPDV
ncbi:hypothetical protein NPIL_558451 [Nephila pilipes]|uniref:Uncharacterized protein n=1 Tax=Nephila pilipes TaxID=299642 RepID=A0A8X6PA06_NEPPI|nr:hypothetical protein NPIL_558451 [Nephila pilipes]